MRTTLYLFESVNKLQAVELWQLYSLEVQVLESEVCFHNTSSFDSGPQHILLGGYVSAVGYPVQVI